jgi:hypothetical protein
VRYEYAVHGRRGELRGRIAGLKIEHRVHAGGGEAIDVDASLLDVLATAEAQLYLVRTFTSSCAGSDRWAKRCSR